MAPVATVLAVDLGGSSLRVALMGRDGGVLALHAEPTEGTATEADPEGWWRALRAGAEALRREDATGFAAIGAVAATGFTRSLVLLGRDGAPLRPALLWGDARAAPVVPELLERLPAAHPERVQVNAFHPLARLAWIARQEPGVMARAVAVIEAKDEVNRRLTGRIASDRISSARLAASAALLVVVSTTT